MIYIASDHGGFALKKELLTYLQSFDTIEDVGNTILDPQDDYPDYAIPLAQKVVQTNSIGVVVCRSAGGVVIACNKVKGAKCVHCIDEKSATHAREHNNANIVAISGDWTSFEKAKKIIAIFLKTQFTHEKRHVRRIQKIEEYEQ